MIQKIFIPTLHRVDNQITYNNLPDDLKDRVVMVVQAWERPLYKYDCEYLVLPDTDEYHFSNYYCLPKTRKMIYQAGRNMKYAVIDDDIVFFRRNARYFGQESNMETSKRKATPDDVLEMFDLFDGWLDKPDVTVCGCSHMENPPMETYFSKNSSLSSALWINGPDFTDILDELDLTSIKVAEDACFLLSLLTRGYGNRVSGEFIFQNNSVYKKDLKSAVWDQQTYEQTQKDHQYLEKMFPGIYNIVYDEDGNRAAGGYRNAGKSKILWSKAYKKSQISSLEKFFS
jgi:hypothetical protein